MNRPPDATRPRPPHALRRAPRSRAEAAVELVRLEFDTQRLKRELALLNRRLAGVSAELASTRNRADRVLAHLSMEQKP